MTTRVTYLGDGVYCEDWPAGNGIKLYTSNGMHHSQPIYLEADVLQKLRTFLTLNPPQPAPRG
jgi:hypothetical protein